MDSFQRHIGEGRYLVVPWSKDVANEASLALERCLSADSPIWLRSLDGLHLGAAASAGISSIITADLRMLDAAELLGLQIVSPS